ncbi:Intracellular sulfur oxidation protein DsrH [Oceanimonas sp. GK1]|uniref:sulfurtransferase complex subunit TusB n=1 Tax=Oceanimonas sp. (strain GK1 / IBRC-M 10197) TaxID=511062 RepID=UPI00024955F4|nr:sulfurtransferase complex subunit TusB [Oceanimonas sp. GK1]AEY02952.1 Intracellular sulfur oxidation protein DsrH [Oceanimonas sp. GK1]
MLHTVKHSPFSHHSLELAMGYLQPGDQLVLWQDGVIAATLPAWQARLQPLADAGGLFVMQEDLEARGLEPVIGTPLTMAGLVELIAAQGSPTAW